MKRLAIVLCLLFAGCGPNDGHSLGINAGVVQRKSCISGSVHDEWTVWIVQSGSSSQRSVTEAEFRRVELGDYVQFNRDGDIIYIKHESQ